MVSPTAESMPRGNSGLAPSDINRAVTAGEPSQNGGVEVNTSMASMENEKMSAGFDSVIGGPIALTISGASKPSTARGPALAVKLGLRLMDPSPYLAKRTRPAWSTRTLICEIQAKNEHPVN